MYGTIRGICGVGEILEVGSKTKWCQPNDSLCDKFQALNIISFSDNTQPTEQQGNDWSSNDGAVGGNINAAIDSNHILLNSSAEFEGLFHGDLNAYDTEDLENIDWSREFEALLNDTGMETDEVDNIDWSREYEELFGAPPNGNNGCIETGAEVDKKYSPLGTDDASDNENDNDDIHQRRLEKVRRELFP